MPEKEENDGDGDDIEDQDRTARDDNEGIPTDAAKVSYDLPDVLKTNEWYDALEQFLEYKFLRQLEPLAVPEGDVQDAEEVDEQEAEHGRQKQKKQAKTQGNSDVSFCIYIVYEFIDEAMLYFRTLSWFKMQYNLFFYSLCTVFDFPSCQRSFLFVDYTIL